MKALLVCGVLFLLLFTIAVTADESTTSVSTNTMVSSAVATSANIAPCDPGTPGCQPAPENS